MYKSPIELIQKQMQLDMESKIVSAVQEVGININKEELIRALKYDRAQYEKGYNDAKAEQGDVIPVEWIKAQIPDSKEFYAVVTSIILYQLIDKYQREQM